MVCAGQLPAGTLDLVLAGVPWHAQDLVEVLVRHQPGLATTTCAGRSWLAPSPYPGRTTSATVSASVPGPPRVASSADPRPDALGARVRLGAGAGPGRDRLVPGGVEPSAAVVTAREAQAGQHAKGLLPDRLDPVDNGGRVGRGVRQREIEAVDHGQPLTGHGGSGILLGAAGLGGGCFWPF